MIKIDTLDELVTSLHYGRFDDRRQFRLFLDDVHGVAMITVRVLQYVCLSEMWVRSSYKGFIVESERWWLIVHKPFIVEPSGPL